MRLPATSIFVLPDEGCWIVYAPLRGLVFRANARAVAQLRECCERRDLSRLDPGVAQALGGADWILDQPEPQPEPVDRPFEPSRVTLFLTSRCNLRCTYCYAEAGEHPQAEMGEHIWRAAIDYAFANAARLGQRLHVGFHGGGEPTLAWDALEAAVLYARHVSREHAAGLQFALATNGLLNEEKIEFIARNFPGLVLSLDGPRDIQNAQRPKPNGRGSFDQVMATVAALRDRHVPFTIRATITELSVRRMVEMVDFFTDQTGCRNLAFEPAFGCGRCARAENGAPSQDVFVEEFIRAVRRGMERRVAVRYSGARLLNQSTSFCGVAQDGFSITPDGLVTSCFQVCDGGHPLAGEFVYGRFDREAGAFRIDLERLYRLRAMVLPNKEYCDHCFCRWHCAGDCPIRVREVHAEFGAPSPRCEMNQRITRGLLLRVLEGLPCPERTEPATSS